MTGTAPAAHDEFVFHGGRRRSLRFWLVVLPVLLIIAIVALVSALAAPASADPGGVGHLAIPSFVAVISLLGLVITVAQWWEDETFFRAEGDGVTIRHGAGGMRGRTTVLMRALPVRVTVERSGSNQAVFVGQGSARVRLGDVITVGPLQQTNLEAWLRAQGMRVERA